MEKSEYDGSGKKGNDDNKTDGNVTGSNTSSGNAPAQNCRPSRKKETAPRAAKTRLKVDKVKLADGTFTNTMEHPLKNLGGIFSPDLLARLLCLKKALLPCFYQSEC